MICTDIAGKTYREILEILQGLEMARIHLDLCPMENEQVEDIFSQTDIPLVAAIGGDFSTSLLSGRNDKEALSGRNDKEAISRRNDKEALSGISDKEAHFDRKDMEKLFLAIESGARFAELDVDAPSELSRRFQKLCRQNGTEIIRSYTIDAETLDEKVLQMALARCFRYGADIAAIVPKAVATDAPKASTPSARTNQAAASADKRLQTLYSVVLEGVDSMQGRLIAYGSPEGKVEALRRGAPFVFASIQETADLRSTVYKGRKFISYSGLRMPASKSFAQRAIVAAALAEGTSRLYDYSPCGDSEKALAFARQLGATIQQDGSTLVITGIGPITEPLLKTTVDAGESGLLARIAIPVLSAVNGVPFEVTGSGTLPERPLSEVASIMAAFGVLMSDRSGKPSRDLFVPLEVRGTLIPGTAEISGERGSQLTSGLLMALPLCPKDSILQVTEPRSIPYMYMTLDILRHFGVSTRSEMEGDAALLEAEDWSACSGITFKIRGRQKLHAAELGIEPDWSSAAVFLTAGAIWGSAEIEGLDMKSIQADIAIVDILVEAGALVSQLEDGTICARRAPLEGFTVDLGHSPDLLPLVAVLAAFCAGRSVVSGVARLGARTQAVLEMLLQMGVEASLEGDSLVVEGETLSARTLCCRLLMGGNYSCRGDHRLAMALALAGLGSSSPIVIDEPGCVAKSYPDFFREFKDYQL